jgi:hypothetical protein
LTRRLPEFLLLGRQREVSPPRSALPPGSTGTASAARIYGAQRKRNASSAWGPYSHPNYGFSSQLRVMPQSSGESPDWGGVAIRLAGEILGRAGSANCQLSIVPAGRARRVAARSLFRQGEANVMGYGLLALTAPGTAVSAVSGDVSTAKAALTQEADKCSRAVSGSAATVTGMPNGRARYAAGGGSGCRRYLIRRPRGTDMALQSLPTQVHVLATNQIAY